MEIRLSRVRMQTSLSLSAQAWSRSYMTNLSTSFQLIRSFATIKYNIRYSDHIWSSLSSSIFFYFIYTSEPTTIRERYKRTYLTEAHYLLIYNYTFSAGPYFGKNPAWVSRKTVSLAHWNYIKLDQNNRSTPRHTKSFMGFIVNFFM